jgi:hypothetical protein
VLKIFRAGTLLMCWWAVSTWAVPGTPSAAASGCGNDQLRGQLGSAELPDCRAFELVSPPFKAGVSMSPNPLIATEGSRMIDGALGLFAGAEQNTGAAGVGAYYQLERGAAGWVAGPVPPPPLSQFPASEMTQDASPDLSRTPWLLRASSQPEGERDVYRREGDGTFAHVGPMQPLGEPPRFGNDGFYVGASHDLTHVLLSKRPRQGRWPGDTTTGFGSLYEYAGTEQAEPKLVGVKNAGALKSNTEAQLLSECETDLGSAPDKYNAISASGATVFFTAHACGSSPTVDELYARIEGAHTLALSEPLLPAGQCTGTCGTAEQREGVFQGASENGSRAFFMTEQPLLNGDRDNTNDLYEAEISGAKLARLTMISEGETQGGAGENDPTPGEGAELLGVARVSQDGSHVYFVATGELTRAANGQGDHAESGARNLYVYDTATRRTAFVAKLSEEDTEVWKRQDNGRPVATTPDGRFLVLVSHADLTGEQGVSGQQVYRYDANSGAIRRLSLGQHSSSEALAPRIAEATYEQASLVTQSQSTLTMSDDGAYVFFESPDGLTPQALDDQALACLFEFGGHCFASIYAQNIYEYHGGHVYLIATLRDTSGARRQRLIATDASGADVFFMTADPLLANDTDTQVDLYDARIEGGFPPQPGPAACPGDACRGPLSPAPPISEPATASQLAGENASPAPERRTTSSHRRKKRRHRASHRRRHGGRTHSSDKARRQS